MVDDDGAYGRDLRLTQAAEHLDRAPDDVADLADPPALFAAYAGAAAALGAWRDGGRVGPRPPGRLRRPAGCAACSRLRRLQPPAAACSRLQPPEPSRVARALATAPYLWLHDPDGRPRPLRRRDGF